ncbi:hypothetical protein BH20ACI4_BH20ACI4_18830 [soil metagenome]
MANMQQKFSRRTVALFWFLGVAIVIGILIYLEQIALLYVLATIGLVVLLLIVGFSDLENVDRDAVTGFAAKNQ